ncbi:hypothetical protein EDD86DRAFT_210148 [Gorgonomyces haynaldii]|nr:hypothetical protein EDD86DRAFT_210148 [Gorgonomyces haynaldii]
MSNVRSIKWIILRQCAQVSIWFHLHVLFQKAIQLLRRRLDGGWHREALQDLRNRVIHVLFHFFKQFNELLTVFGVKLGTNASHKKRSKSKLARKVKEILFWLFQQLFTDTSHFETHLIKEGALLPRFEILFKWLEFVVWFDPHVDHVLIVQWLTCLFVHQIQLGLVHNIHQLLLESINGHNLVRLLVVEKVQRRKVIPNC